MAEKNENRNPGIVPGTIQKAASLASQEVTDDALKAINKYALTPLTADEVFTFKAVICDNEVDRDFEYFPVKSLKELQKLLLGKTVIKDHTPAADNQVARIYDTELVQGSKTLKSGETYTQLVAHCYMVRTASNADLIAEIKGGIKKEGSVGCAVSSAVCSICGTDNVKRHCAHFRGLSYDKKGTQEVCTFKLLGITDAYEFSLVVVPAQRAAGVSKSYTGETVFEKDMAEEVEPPADPVPSEDEETAKELNLRARIYAARAKHQKTEKE